MKRRIRLTETQLIEFVKKIIYEQPVENINKDLVRGDTLNVVIDAQNKKIVFQTKLSQGFKGTLDGKNENFLIFGNTVKYFGTEPDVEGFIVKSVTKMNEEGKVLGTFEVESDGTISKKRLAEQGKTGYGFSSTSGMSSRPNPIGTSGQSSKINYGSSGNSGMGGRTMMGTSGNSTSPRAKGAYSSTTGTSGRAQNSVG